MPKHFPSFAGVLIALSACTPSRHETPAPATSLPAASSAAAPGPVPPAPAPQAGTAPPKEVELPREVAPGSGSEGEPREKKASDCKDDRDCRAFSHYCEGCFCVALAKTANDLKCRGAHTSCFVDPCRAQRAVCRKGACALAAEAEK